LGTENNSEEYICKKSVFSKNKKEKKTENANENNDKNVESAEKQ